MVHHTSLAPHAPWVRLDTTQEDWDAADPGLLGTMLVQLQVIRSFEESVLDLAGKGLVHGPAHSSIGQEGGAVGALVAARSTDAINGSHRGHHQFLAKALTHVAGDLEPAAELPDDVLALLRRTLAEILGLREGFCRGRGGSMHLQWFDAGALGTNAIVGGGVPLAAGNAWAQRLAGTDDVTFTFFGDGAMNIGSTLESLNLAGAFDLPVCFFVENNLYAVSTHVSEVTAEPRLSARGLGFAMPAWQVDGMDPLAVHLATQQAVAHMRAGKGPTLIEAEVYRYFHQNGPYPGSAFGYRHRDEEATWRARDPLARVASEMVRRGLLTDDDVTALRDRVEAAMSTIVDGLTEADEAAASGRRIRPELWPDPDFVDVGIRGDASELDAALALEEADHTGETREVNFSDAIAATLGRRMATDDRVVVLGEDVHRLKGGTNGATKGLVDQFGERVFGTPISENAFVGAAGGMALDGRVRPVVELMYADFLWVAADQLFNQLGKARHMFGGERAVPVVVRGKVAMGTGYGSQHSMDPAGIMATAPGWRVVAASTPFDAVGLLNAALALDDPVFVIEHTDLYKRSGPVPAGDLDHQTPFGRAAVRREGSEVTVLTYLSMVAESLEAVAEVGVDAEVIDLRWLDRASIDWETIGASITKTNAVVIAEQGALGTSYGAWLADEIQRRFFDHLDQPVQRVTGSVASPSISKVLERAAIAKAPEVATVLRSVVADMGA